jgi:murein DD-endopeptidase MepM/ murein hydrolase activator NlpD
VGPEQYQVLSWSGSGWTQAAAVSNSTHEAVTTSYINVYTDWIMINISEPGTDSFVRIPEIEVYVMGDTHPDPGTGRIGWAFSGSKDNRGLWAQVTGSSLHVGDDQHAEDWASGAYTCGAPFYSPIAGTVLYAGYTGDGSGFASYGYQIVIRSSINRGYAFRVAHLQAGSITKTVGSQVSVGELIGRVGGTPNWSCHAHMVVYKDIRMTSPINGLKGVDNLKLGSSPSGAVTSSYVSPFPMEFNPDAPGRPMNP